MAGHQRASRLDSANSGFHHLLNQPHRAAESGSTPGQSVNASPPPAQQETNSRQPLGTNSFRRQPNQPLKTRKQIHADINKMTEKLQTKHDETMLKVHLARKRRQDEWTELQDRWKSFKVAKPEKAKEICHAFEKSLDQNSRTLPTVSAGTLTARTPRMWCLSHVIQDITARPSLTPRAAGFEVSPAIIRTIMLSLHTTIATPEQSDLNLSPTAAPERHRRRP